MTPPPALSVIVVNWNAREWLERCLLSVLTQETAGRSFEVILVDNASSDGSAAFVGERFPGVCVIALQENRGFAGGNNLGIEASAGRNVLLLNPDTETHPGAFSALLDFLDAHPQCGIAGPKLLNTDGSLQYSCRHFPTISAGFFRNTPLGKLFPGAKAARDYLMKDVPHDHDMPVDWVSGAAMLIRREVIGKVGALDEGYFMYTEDMDICYRAHAAGFEVWYVPEAVVTHAIGQSSDKAFYPMIRAFHRATFRFFSKHYFGRRYPAWLKPFFAAALVVRAALVSLLGAWHRLTRRNRRRVRV